MAATDGSEKSLYSGEIRAPASRAPLLPCQRSTRPRPPLAPVATLLLAAGHRACAAATRSPTLLRRPVRKLSRRRPPQS